MHDRLSILLPADNSSLRAPVSRYISLEQQLGECEAQKTCAPPSPPPPSPPPPHLPPSTPLPTAPPPLLPMPAVPPLLAEPDDDAGSGSFDVSSGPLQPPLRPQLQPLASPPSEDSMLWYYIGGGVGGIVLLCIIMLLSQGEAMDVEQ